MTCGQTSEEAHRRIADFILEQYDGKKGMTVYVREEIVGKDWARGSTRLYGERAESVDCHYAEPDILIERMGEISCIIEVDSASSGVVELTGKAMAPLLAESARPEGKILPLARDLQVIQIVCMLPSDDSYRDWECRFSSLEDDIVHAYGCISPERGYAAILPLRREDETVEKVLTPLLEGKII